MIVTVASYKGGVGKTTTAVHFAAYFSVSLLQPTVLFDADKTRSATAWSKRGEGFPFSVAPAEAAAKLAALNRHCVFDSGQRPTEEDLEAAAQGSDLLVIPAVPSALDTDGLGQTIRALQKIGATNYRVLLTKVAPDAAAAALELRRVLAEANAPVFAGEIPRLKAFEKAADAGVVVVSAQDRNAARAWEAYAAVGRELKV